MHISWCMCSCMEYSSIKCFITLTHIHYFIPEKKRSQKMLNITVLNRKTKRLRPNIVDDYLISKEWIEKKEEPENIGTEKSKRELICIHG